MQRRLAKSRQTKVLIELAHDKFYACEVCWRSDALDFIEDVVAPLRLKNREAKRLFRSLTCPSCESTVSISTLVVKVSEQELRYAAQAKRFDKKYGRDIIEFKKFLIQYPMLGATHPFAPVLSQAIKRAKKTLLMPRTWYHASNNTTKPVLPLRRQEKAAKAGRFHQIGQMVIYVGNDQKTAVVEVLRKPIEGRQHGIAEVKLLEPLAILDLRWRRSDERDPTGHWILRNVVDRRFISDPTDDSDESCPQYRLPQYIADLARKHGFQGILYDSTRPSAYNNPEAFGHNLVIFHPLPQYTVYSEMICEFAEPDNDIWGPERWVLRTQLL